MKPLNVSDIGEQELLRRLHQFCPPHLVGDDAALLAVDPEHRLVVTTDVLIDGVHFSVGHASPDTITTSPEDAGWRAIAANLSDLAAMGATPMAVTVGLSLPGHVPVAQVEGLYRGMQDCLSTFGGVIAGGDVCRSPVISLAISALGQVKPGQAIVRTAAQPGDVILATGVHGASRAGLELLLSPDCGVGVSEGDRTALISAHQRPRPRFDVIHLLHNLNAFDSKRSLAGMDSSDGLADAIIQICRTSGVGARIECENLPMPPCFSSWLSPEQAIDWTLYGGEDFELVLCVPESVGRSLVDRLSTASIIGTITVQQEVLLIDSSRSPNEVPLVQSRGFQHF
ncbi:MAG: thiamine-phosphate kinase [Leptolyngbyaceae bacterium]|nr:thiamine-phosphate kinase [Leptolyngbyaceae bacterium]